MKNKFDNNFKKLRKEIVERLEIEDLESFQRLQFKLIKSFPDFDKKKWNKEINTLVEDDSYSQNLTDRAHKLIITRFVEE
jgi:hypothetical protein